MKQKLAHILDTSSCITKRQLKDYAAGTMSTEECHAMEHHVNGCAFCSDALDGALLHTPGETVAIAALNGSFIKAHFGLQSPHIHLNSMAPTIGPKSKHKMDPFWLKTSIAAVILVGAVLLYLQTGKGILSHPQHFSLHNEVNSEAAK